MNKLHKLTSLKEFKRQLMKFCMAHGFTPRNFTKKESDPKLDSGEAIAFDNSVINFDDPEMFRQPQSQTFNTIEIIKHQPQNNPSVVYSIPKLDHKPNNRILSPLKDQE